MNDLQTLRTALTTDEPSREVVDRSRHQLQNRIRGGRVSRKRPGWLTVGTGLVAAATAATVAISAIPTAPVDGPPVQTVSGQEILLAAATAAEQSPEGSGDYWHVTATLAQGSGKSTVYEYWTKPDGQRWFRDEKTGGKVMPQVGRDGAKPFELAAVDLTLEQMRALPTDPDALRAWIAQALEHSDARTSKGRLTASDREYFTLLSLVSLVSAVPAPPQVRAAAFRAIASYPGVDNLGAVPGGQGLLLPRNLRLVVDPATGRVNTTSVYVNGAMYVVSDPAGATINAEWTNTLPA